MKHKLLSLIPASFFVLSCLLPGMIPLTSLPDMEKDSDTVLEILNGEGWLPLQALAVERYTEDDFAKPGTLTFTATVTNETPVFFSYGWCAVDEETLLQNFEHITVLLSIDDEPLDSEVIHGISYASPSRLVCSEVGVLLSNWSSGAYELKAVATFAEKINDGLADFDAGDYIFVYNVTIEE